MERGLGRQANSKHLEKQQGKSFGNHGNPPHETVSNIPKDYRSSYKEPKRNPGMGLHGHFVRCELAMEAL